MEIYGPPGVTDLLVYGQERREVRYDENGLAMVELTFSEPGLVAVYKQAGPTKDVVWTTVEQATFPIPVRQRRSYIFDEMGLYHYRVVDNSGQVVAGPQANPQMVFTVEPGLTYQAQLAYPETSLFVGLYDHMQFEHPAYWTMPIDAHQEQKFEFQVEYHRQSDPTSDNYLLNGVVVDRLFMASGPSSVARQFSYGRHDDAPPGVTLVGIPDVSMVAFCQRPGYHELVYWGGWENESYYLPERGHIFDQKLAEKWSDRERADCLDAARRINMALAREGLRTDHTYRHHGERSQGYQMVQQQVWSPYNLVGMRPPHVAQVLKPGTVLPFYQTPEEKLFWGWDLEKGGLASGVDAERLEEYADLLGPVVYDRSYK